MCKCSREVNQGVVEPSIGSGNGPVAGKPFHLRQNDVDDGLQLHLPLLLLLRRSREGSGEQGAAVSKARLRKACTMAAEATTETAAAAAATTSKGARLHTSFAR